MPLQWQIGKLNKISYGFQQKNAGDVMAEGKLLNL